jgi:hypothetical protein
MSRSTIPAPHSTHDEFCASLGIDPCATRQATVTRALAARMRRESTAEATAAMQAAGERPASERLPDARWSVKKTP